MYISLLLHLYTKYGQTCQICKCLAQMVQIQSLGTVEGLLKHIINIEIPLRCGGVS